MMKWIKLTIILLLTWTVIQPVQAMTGEDIHLGLSRSEVEQQFGKPKRVTMSEYQLSWSTYHDNYANFLMAMYENNKVVGFYRNDNFTYQSVKLGMTRAAVRQALGKPVTYVLKGNTNYEMKSDEWDMFANGDEFQTVFYDQHKGYKATAILVMKKSLEQRKKGYYGVQSATLKAAFELQNFDLTNAIRHRFGQPILKWDKKAQLSSAKHSQDMARNNYFDHVSLTGKEPWDRMKAAGIKYMECSENIAYGQFNSIFAHEGWMNSEGHRNNILNAKWRYLGVGVAFAKDTLPYYTQNFWTNE